MTWMSTTGAQAEHTASQASAAASAYEAAFAMTVPPAEVAANRAQLMALIATNVLGQNTAAIAANEAQYGEMWAQDAAAMYGYAGNSAAAATVKPFRQPPQTANPNAQTLQSSAVTQATGASTGTGVQSQLQQLTSTIPSSLNNSARRSQRQRVRRRMRPQRQRVRSAESSTFWMARTGTPSEPS